MTPLPILREAIQPRLDGIQRNIETLEKFGNETLENFSKPEIIERAAYHLRLALEGVFHITAHLLSRFPQAIKIVMENPDRFGTSIE